MVLPHHAGKFLPKTKGFFPHDFTLIASVVGESVIGHGIVGEDIPIMARLAKARRWSKRWQTRLTSSDLTATQISDGSKIQVRRRHVLHKDPMNSYIEDLMYFSNEYLERACVVGILKRISYEILVSYVSK